MFGTLPGIVCLGVWKSDVFCGKIGNPQILSFLLFRVCKIRGERLLLLLFYMCRYLFEIDADLKTEFCIGFPATFLIASASSVQLKKSSIHASKGGSL